MTILKIGKAEYGLEFTLGAMDALERAFDIKLSIGDMTEFVRQVTSDRKRVVRTAEIMAGVSDGTIAQHAKPFALPAIQTAVLDAIASGMTMEQGDEDAAVDVVLESLKKKEH